MGGLFVMIESASTFVWDGRDGRDHWVGERCGRSGVWPWADATDAGHVDGWGESGKMMVEGSVRRSGEGAIAGYI